MWTTASDDSDSPVIIPHYWSPARKVQAYVDKHRDDGSRLKEVLGTERGLLDPDNAELNPVLCVLNGYRHQPNQYTKTFLPGVLAGVHATVNGVTRDDRLAVVDIKVANRDLMNRPGPDDVSALPPHALIDVNGSIYNDRVYVATVLPATIREAYGLIEPATVHLQPDCQDFKAAHISYPRGVCELTDWHRDGVVLSFNPELPFDLGYRAMLTVVMSLCTPQRLPLIDLSLCGPHELKSLAYLTGARLCGLYVPCLLFVENVPPVSLLTEALAECLFVPRASMCGRGHFVDVPHPPFPLWPGPSAGDDPPSSFLSFGVKTIEGFDVFHHQMGLLYCVQKHTPGLGLEPRPRAGMLGGPDVVTVSKNRYEIVLGGRCRGLALRWDPFLIDKNVLNFCRPAPTSVRMVVLAAPHPPSLPITAQACLKYGLVICSADCLNSGFLLAIIVGRLFGHQRLFVHVFSLDIESVLTDLFVWQPLLLTRFLQTYLFLPTQKWLLQTEKVLLSIKTDSIYNPGVIPAGPPYVIMRSIVTAAAAAPLTHIIAPLNSIAATVAAPIVSLNSIAATVAAPIVSFNSIAATIPAPNSRLGFTAARRRVNRLCPPTAAESISTAACPPTAADFSLNSTADDTSFPTAAALGVTAEEFPLTAAPHAFTAAPGSTAAPGFTADDTSFLTAASLGVTAEESPLTAATHAFTAAPAEGFPAASLEFVEGLPLTADRLSVTATLNPNADLHPTTCAGLCGDLSHLFVIPAETEPTKPKGTPLTFQVLKEGSLCKKGKLTRIIISHPVIASLTPLLADDGSFATHVSKTDLPLHFDIPLSIITRLDFKGELSAQGEGYYDQRQQGRSRHAIDYDGVEWASEESWASCAKQLLNYAAPVTKACFSQHLWLAAAALFNWENQIQWQYVEDVSRVVLPPVKEIRHLALNGAIISLTAATAGLIASGQYPEHDTPDDFSKKAPLVWAVHVDEAVLLGWMCRAVGEPKVNPGILLCDVTNNLEAFWRLTSPRVSDLTVPGTLFLGTSWKPVTKNVLLDVMAHLTVTGALYCYPDHMLWTRHGGANVWRPPLTSWQTDDYSDAILTILETCLELSGERDQSPDNYIQALGLTLAPVVIVERVALPVVTYNQLPLDLYRVVTSHAHSLFTGTVGLNNGRTVTAAWTTPLVYCLNVGVLGWDPAALPLAPVLTEPNLTVYDGHKRLTKLKELRGSYPRLKYRQRGLSVTRSRLDPPEALKRLRAYRRYVGGPRDPLVEPCFGQLKEPHQRLDQIWPSWRDLEGQLKKQQIEGAVTVEWEEDEATLTVASALTLGGEGVVVSALVTKPGDDVKSVVMTNPLARRYYRYRQYLDRVAYSSDKDGLWKRGFVVVKHVTWNPREPMLKMGKWPGGDTAFVGFYDPASKDLGFLSTLLDTAGVTHLNQASQNGTTCWSASVVQAGLVLASHAVMGAVTRHRETVVLTNAVGKIMNNLLRVLYHLIYLLGPLDRRILVYSEAKTDFVEFLIKETAEGELYRAELPSHLSYVDVFLVGSLCFNLHLPQINWRRGVPLKPDQWVMVNQVELKQYQNKLSHAKVLVFCPDEMRLPNQMCVTPSSLSYLPGLVFTDETPLVRPLSYYQPDCWHAVAPYTLHDPEVNHRLLSEALFDETNVVPLCRGVTPLFYHPPLYVGFHAADWDDLRPALTVTPNGLALGILPSGVYGALGLCPLAYDDRPVSLSAHAVQHRHMVTGYAEFLYRGCQYLQYGSVKIYCRPLSEASIQRPFAAAEAYDLVLEWAQGPMLTSRLTLSDQGVLKINVESPLEDRTPCLVLGLMQATLLGGGSVALVSDCLDAVYAVKYYCDWLHARSKRETPCVSVRDLTLLADGAYLGNSQIKQVMSLSTLNTAGDRNPLSLVTKDYVLPLWKRVETPLDLTLSELNCQANLLFYDYVIDQTLTLLDGVPPHLVTIYKRLVKKFKQDNSPEALIVFIYGLANTYGWTQLTELLTRPLAVLTACRIEVNRPTFEAMVLL
ncbi:protein ORF22 [Lake sturgeon herpesvirus]|nr:protein ORF22 [Lake sturgeon herpesvirus]